MFHFEYTKESDRFNKPDANITFKSSDGVLFVMHKKNLATHAEGFPYADDSVETEIVELPEDSETLELLFQYVYPEHVNDLPDLADISFPLLMKLSAAAEKYVVYIVIPLCKVRMLTHVKSYYTPKSLQNLMPSTMAELKRIIKHAATHSGYMSILDEGVPLLAVSSLSKPLESSLVMFPPSKHVSWAVYREQWAVFQREVSPIFGPHRTSMVQDSGLLTFMDSNIFKCNDSFTKNLVTSKFDKIRKFSTISGEVPKRIDTGYLVSELKSARFNKKDADINVKSSDGVRFSLHKENLDTHASGFSHFGDEIIHLPEDYETLELLFQFLYPEDMGDIPDLVDTSLPLLMKLSNAAEKYVVHIAIPLCKVHILFHVRSYYKIETLQHNFHATLDNLRIIVKHSANHAGYMRIMDEAAPLLAVTHPLESSLALFPTEGQLPWAIYRELWTNLHRELVTYNKWYSSVCEKCDMQSQFKLDFHILTLHRPNIPCFQCIHGETARQHVLNKIKTMRKFSSVYNAPYSKSSSFENTCHIM